MSKLETNTIDTVSGTANLTIGGANNTGTTTIKTNNTDAVTIDSSQNLKFNSGYGSVATAYGCRAWVNFNGQGTVAIRESGNVSSITDNSTGNYTVNFTTNMPDANYAVSLSSDFMNKRTNDSAAARTVSAVGVLTLTAANAAADALYVDVAVFR